MPRSPMVACNARSMGLTKYFDTKVPGLWFDRLDPNGQMVIEPSPASSLYHIVGAVAELVNLVSGAATQAQA